MSKTEECLRKAREKGGTLLRVSPQRNGKTLAAAVLEATTEMRADPPATAEEARAFCRLQIKRCNVNLANAKDRGDKRAVVNLERKLAVYEYLYGLTEEKIALEDITDCSSCRVHAVGKDGVCACCGKTVFEGGQNAEIPLV